MIILYILITLLAIAVLLLALALHHLVKNGAYISDKEKEFIVFVINIFKDYGDDLGIQSKDQHKKLVEELDKIKNKYLKTKNDDKTGNADGKV